MGYLETTIFFVCNDPERALGLENVFPNYHVVCIDDNLMVDYIREAGGKVFCLERELGEQNVIFRNSNKLLQQSQTQEYIGKNTPENESTKVIFFKIASNLERTCESLNYRVLNTTSSLNKKFETKISQYNLLKDEAVNFPKTVVGRLRDFEYKKLVEDLGENFVIQYARGHTGSSTIFVDEKTTFTRELEKYPKRMARVARKIEGDAWTINACATRFGVLYGGLSYQVTGVSDLTSREGGTVGNDWAYSRNLSKFTLEQIEKITIRVGKIMKRHGYRGLYGLDLIVDDNGEVFLIEINARQPASTSMHTKIMLEQGLVPLQLFHIAEFLHEDDKSYYRFVNRIYNSVIKKDREDLQDLKLQNQRDAIEFRNDQNPRAMKPVSAAQIFLRNNTSDSVIIDKLVEPGVYIYDAEPIRSRDGYSISDIKEEGEFILLAQNVGKKINPGNELARVQVKDSVVDEEGRLQDWVLDVLLNTKGRLGLQ